MTGMPLYFAHISDLHLGRNANDTGTMSKADARSVLRDKHMEMQSHDGYILSALRTELRACARALGAPDDEFDFYVVTGDISTHADSEVRFRFAREYITGRVQWESGFSIGLGLDKDRVICIPGNHDKMFETSPARYLVSFGDLPAKPPFVYSREARNGRTVTFFGIDSNRYKQGEIGVGLIDPETFGWLKDNLDRWHGPPNELRILLLHHHPVDLNRFRSRSLKNLFAGLVTRFKDGFTVLEEGARLLEACRNRVHIIMHGHEHFPIAFVDDTSNCLVVSAGTTSEWQRTGRGNSFHAIRILRGQAEVHQYDWNGASFTASENAQSYALPSLTSLADTAS